MSLPFALLLASTGAVTVSDEALKELPREERVRVLKERTWEIVAARVVGELKLDGHVDEPAWAEASPIMGFFQQDRNEGLPGSERTEVRVLFDETNLYVGFKCFDREPELVKARSIYNTDTHQLSTNVRFNWIFRPGSDFFIVYNELDEWGSIFGVRNRSLVVKMNYWFAL